jgi:ureidoglycolate hydrolase
MKIQPIRISSDNFTRFGSIVIPPTDDPTAKGPTFEFWSDIARYRIDGETEIGLCTVSKQETEIVNVVERHLKTPEILIPIDAPFDLPLVADDGSVSAFRVAIGEAVVVNSGVWHGPCIPVGKKECSYFVIFRRGTPNTDVEKKSIEKVEIG